MEIDGIRLSECVLSASSLLRKNEKTVNDLNVYPVPDGDTGSNMRGTLADASLSVSFASVGKSASELSSRMLKSARGNSGAILSQFFRGFAQGLDGVSFATVSDFAKAMSLGTEFAYSAVSQPVEGTMLTVMHAASEKADELSQNPDISFPQFFELICDRAKDVLFQTTDMLPALKEAKVVDAGGLGFLIILLGFYCEISGKELPEISSGFTLQKADFSAIKTEDIRYTFCVEAVLSKKEERLGENKCAELGTELFPLGDSLVFIETENAVKLHIHTNSPETVFETAKEYGSLESEKVENMALQHTNLISAEVPADHHAIEKAFGLVFVSVGEGFSGIFSDLGADRIVFGGQTMNPSVGEISEALALTPAKNVFLFPGNKNIILTANQAADLVSDRKVFVIPTKSLPQSVSAALCFDPELSAEENAEAMRSVTASISTVSVTRAIKDAVINGRQVAKGQYVGLLNGELKSVGSDAESCLSAFEDDLAGAEFINIYYGEEVSEKQAKKTAETVGNLSPEGETELIFGGQPLYDYLISLE